MLSKTQIKNKEVESTWQSVDIKISKSQISHVVNYEWWWLISSPPSLGTKMQPMATNFASKIFQGLVTSALSSLRTFRMDTILGQGQAGGFLASQGKINQLIKYKHLTTKQKQVILNTPQ